MVYVEPQMRVVVPSGAHGTVLQINELFMRAYVRLDAPDSGWSTLGWFDYKSLTAEG